MHTIIFRIVVQVRDKTVKEWVLERNHVLPVEPRPGMEVRDRDMKYIWRVPAELFLEKENDKFIWVNETKTTQQMDQLEGYLKMMKEVHRYELVKVSC